MRWDHLAPTAPEAVREAHRLLQVAGSYLTDLEGNRRMPEDLRRSARIAANRAERARRLLERGMPEWSAGMCIHYGEHRYVSTYCQHALALEADGLEGTELHQQCRRSCKTCDAPCRCTAPGCPCVAARNRGNVGGATDTPPGRTHGQAP